MTLMAGKRHRLGDDVADVDVGPVDADHVEPFERGRRDPHDLHHHVGAPPVGQLLHPLHPRLGCRELVEVDDVGGPALPRHRQAMGLPVDGDDLGGALLRGHRRRVDAEPTRALDGHDIAELHVRVLDAVEHLAEGAVDRGDGLVGQDVGHREDVVAGRQVVVVGVAAVAVGVLVQVELLALALPVRAGVVLAADAPVAAVAGIEEGKGHPVAFLQGPPQRVCGDAAPQAVDHAGELVTGDAPQIGPGVVAVVAPVVEVRAADGRGGVPDEDAPGLDLGRRQHLQLEWLSRLIQDGGQSLGHVCLLLARSWGAPGAPPAPLRSERPGEWPGRSSSLVRNSASAALARTPPRFYWICGRPSPHRRAHRPDALGESQQAARSAKFSAPRAPRGRSGARRHR